MERLAPAAKALLIFALAFRLHHHVHGPAIDYVGLAAACAASWFGVPGPGEPVLIAAGVFAARHRLDIVSVVFVAFLAANAGGIAGWLVGLKGGRAILTSKGPMHKMRMKLLARGDEMFERYAVIAIILTPPVLAGIHRVRTSLYLITNAVSAFVWAVGIGLGAYFVGPPVIDAVGDLGVLTTVALGVLIAVTIGARQLRRRRRGSQDSRRAE